MITRFPKINFNCVLGDYVWFCIVWKSGTNLLIHLEWSLVSMNSVQSHFVTSFTYINSSSHTCSCVRITCPACLSTNCWVPCLEFWLGRSGIGLSALLTVPRWCRWYWLRNHNFECRYSENSWVWLLFFRVFEIILLTELQEFILISFSPYFEVNLYLLSILYFTSLLLLIFSASHIQDLLYY